MEEAKIVTSPEQQPDNIKENLGLEQEETKKEEKEPEKEEIISTSKKKIGQEELTKAREVLESGKEPEEKREPTAEKTREQILDDTRKEYVRVDLDAEKYVTKMQKEFGQKKSKEDFERYKQAKDKYLEALKEHRVELYDKAAREMEKLGLSEKEADKKFKEKMEEIIRETIVKEANRLYDQKMDLQLEAKGEASKVEKMKNLTSRVIEKYRRMPLRHKLMISGGLLAGGVVAGAVSGATGAALATGLVAGRWFQRTLGGAATAVGLEGLIKRSQEKKAEKKTLAKLANKLEKNIKDNDKKLDERLFKLEGSKERQKYWRYTLAGTMGALIGSGLVAKAFHNVFDLGKGIWSPEKIEEMAEKVKVEEGAEKIAESPETEAVAREVLEEKAEKVKVAETTPADLDKAAKTPFKFEGDVKGGEVLTEASAADFIETVHKGDSIWKMAEDQLGRHYGGKFSSLDQARKTYLIDAIKDKVAANPKAFGLEDVDKLKVGQKVDFSSIFEDKSEIEKIFSKADALRQAALENIEKNNQILEEWTKEHPGEKLTSAKVDEILTGKEVAPEIAGPGAETILSENEMRNVEALGFNPDEYKAIQDLKVDKLLKEIPSKHEAWEAWRGPQRIDLPHHGMYGAWEFKKHIKLAEFVRSFDPGEGAKQMTIRQFLRMFGLEKQRYI